MRLHYHSRLHTFQKNNEKVLVVNLSDGRISPMVENQHVLRVNGGVEMEVVE